MGQGGYRPGYSRAQYRTLPPLSPPYITPLPLPLLISMKRVFSQNHVKSMQRFIEANLSETVPGDSERATKILILMDRSQLKLLDLYFSTSLTEEEIDQQLNRLGFLTKINLFEKKAMLNDIARRRLIRIIKDNNTLVEGIKDVEEEDNEMINSMINGSSGGSVRSDTVRSDTVRNSSTGSNKSSINKSSSNKSSSNNTPSINTPSINTPSINTGSNNTPSTPSTPPSTNLINNTAYSLLKNLFKYRLSTPSHLSVNKYYRAEFDFQTQRPTMYLGINRDSTFHKHLSPIVLPLSPLPPMEIKHIRLPRPPSNVNKTPLVTVLPDDGSLLRKKKSLYYEPPSPIDYHTDKSLKLKSVKAELEKCNYKPVLSDYAEYNPRKFIDQIVFINNGIPIPTETKYSSISEFLKSDRGMSKFRSVFLRKRLALLILRQDKTISWRDAEIIGAEARMYLTLAELEYFYGLFRNSREYTILGVRRVT